MPSAPQAYSSPRRTKTASGPHGESRADLEWRSRTLLFSTHPALERFRFLLSRTWLSQMSCLLPVLRPLPARPAAMPGCRRRFDSHVRVEVFARRSKDGPLVVRVDRHPLAPLGGRIYCIEADRDSPFQMSTNRVFAEAQRLIAALCFWTVVVVVAVFRVRAHGLDHIRPPVHEQTEVVFHDFPPCLQRHGHRVLLSIHRPVTWVWSVDTSNNFSCQTSLSGAI